MSECCMLNGMVLSTDWTDLILSFILLLLYLPTNPDLKKSNQTDNFSQCTLKNHREIKFQTVFFWTNSIK